ncbi:MAG TPA: diphosphate--fructose-6-phosphate 1-phosphotransferase [Rectinemataceae bacterium]|nr:diphosphate--fructose-6-phosphate 1-phosphotransferase [Rectinemataceae bacterium]
MEGSVLIGQSGGPTAVINASLAGLVEGCLERQLGASIIGMRHGIEGFMDERLVDLGRQPAAVRAGLRRTPSSVLGSSRHKLREEDFPRIMELLRAYDIRYLFLIGGNDTMDTIHRIEDRCQREGYALRGIGIPKTVDNDLFGTDHSPGFPSAARYVALSVQQAGRLARDMQKVDAFVVHQTVGREAGWLAAASALARRTEGDAPHLIYLPERRLNPERVIADVTACIDRFGWCSIVCGEGVLWEDGNPVSAARERDRFSNTEFGAMGGASAALGLHRLIREATGLRGEFQITESLPMCADDRVSELDRVEAYEVGRRAVDLAEEGRSGVMVSIERKPGPGYAAGYGTVPLSEVAVRAKPMPEQYIAEDGHDVTAAFLGYLRPLVGALPEYADLEPLEPARTRASR